MREQKQKELMAILNIMSPGTLLREGLDNILRAKTGGLVVLSDREEVLKMVDGGFAINSEYTPAYVYELAKMDGAIVISSDLKRILYANTQLMPNPSIVTQETGTRHRTAQRVAKQTGDIVVAISQRRNIISLYKGDIKYVLRESGEVLAKANQAIQTLEKYQLVLNRVISNLNLLELQDLSSLLDVVTAVQRNEMVMRIVYEIETYICELGNEGRLISMQLYELINGVEQEGRRLIRDYCSDEAKYEEIYKNIEKLSSQDLLDLDIIAKVLGYPGIQLVDKLISPRGYRILNMIPRIPSSIVDNMVKHFGELQKIMNASLEELDLVDGIGEARAKAIKNGLRTLKERFILDRQI
ncbi:MAG: DNA integrity scanning diadenylate cyclase DisA [Clostridium sp.]|uniref:DNA integrity scanning diadenylate cyclase DisA n=1 Tax=Clostridium culturomicium TaxID=1499683 RepID=UPI00058D67D1|nr:DNA integrity scanning diadenylate cyclase DisA [Clostridium culturomicium]MDU4892714.1 DNA integrity scanning diadenylate cyclase DisA [Clostridium sp.]MDU7085972.1 DNA integrity scanning diadenylate cyclase DisA [Clostridium sp.]